MKLSPAIKSDTNANTRKSKRWVRERNAVTEYDVTEKGFISTGTTQFDTVRSAKSFMAVASA